MTNSENVLIKRKEFFGEDTLNGQVFSYKEKISCYLLNLLEGKIVKYMKLSVSTAEDTLDVDEGLPDISIELYEKDTLNNSIRRSIEFPTLPDSIWNMIVKEFKNAYLGVGSIPRECTNTKNGVDINVTSYVDGSTSLEFDGIKLRDGETRVKLHACYEDLDEDLYFALLEMFKSLSNIALPVERDIEENLPSM